MRVNAQGWLVSEAGDPPVIAVPTERTTALHVAEPVALVSHWTAGDYAPDRGHQDSVALAEWIRKMPVNGEPAASWHLIIDKDGAVVQSAPFLKGTWHVGKPGRIRGVDHLNVNRFTVGVEYENAGELAECEGRFYAWPFRNARTGAFDPKYEVAAARALCVDLAVAEGERDKYFDRYTPAQEATTEALWRVLRARFDWPREAFTYGHVDFDSPRKIDPGPAFLPLRDRVLTRIFGEPGASP